MHRQTGRATTVKTLNWSSYRTPVFLPADYLTGPVMDEECHKTWSANQCKMKKTNSLLLATPLFSGYICTSWSEMLKQEMVTPEAACGGVGALVSRVPGLTQDRAELQQTRWNNNNVSPGVCIVPSPRNSRLGRVPTGISQCVSIVPTPCSNKVSTTSRSSGWFVYLFIYFSSRITVGYTRPIRQHFAFCLVLLRISWHRTIRTNN